MASTKTLTSVCHSIAHHAASGLSFIHPHLARACREAGVDRAAIDMKRDAPYPAGLSLHEPLRLSLVALRKKAEEILGSEGFGMADLIGLDLLVDFSGCPADDFSSNCYVTIKHGSGKTFESGANFLGSKVTKLEV